MDKQLKNPVVKGTCDSSKCGAICCYTKIFDNQGKFVLEPCEYLDTVELKCKIYETRPEGCRTYPMVNNLKSYIHPGCGYYLDEE